MGYTINCVSINKTIFLCQSYTFYYLASDRDLCSNSHVPKQTKNDNYVVSNTLIWFCSCKNKTAENFNRFQKKKRKIVKKSK